MQKKTTKENNNLNFYLSQRKIEIKDKRSEKVIENTIFSKNM